MATKRKTVKIEDVTDLHDEIMASDSEIVTSTGDVKSTDAPAMTSDEAEIVEAVYTPKTEAPVQQKKSKKVEKMPKYAIGSIVFVAKNAEADLNGFKLFPQYKKYTYTVEAYDAITEVYSLRRLNLSLRLKEADIVAPDERAHDSLNRRQF